MKPHYFSRSASDTDDGCGRARFWNTVFGDRGLESTEPKDALEFGTYIHKGMEEIWTTGKISLETYDFKGLPADMALVGRGLLYAYYNTVYQRYKQEGWKLLYSEQECAAQIGVSPVAKRPLILLAQPDLLLQHEETGIVRYVEIKTTKLLSADYIESWRYAPQLAAGFECVWQTLGIQVDDFVMQLMYKGTYYKDEGRWASVFTSAWRKAFVEDAKQENFHDWMWSAKRPASWKGWERINLIDAYAAGDFTEERWLGWLLAQGALEEQCPETPPMVFNKKMVEAWMRYKCKREGEIADVTHEVFDTEDYGGAGSPDTLAEVFPQKFLKCRPVMGFPCNFLSLCWNPMEEKNPLQSGKYSWRQPHHKTEAEALEGSH
jgi:hypothetical protein